MAIIQYSALINQARGKLNGSVLSRNRSTNTMYRKGQPAKKNTVRQNEVRQAFNFVQRSWKIQPVSVHQAYQLAAENNPTTDRFGNPVVLSAYAMWMRVNIKYFLYWREVLIDIDSSPADPMQWDLFEITEFEYYTTPSGVRNLQISWQEIWNPNPQLAYIALYISPPFSSGQSEFYGSYYFQYGEINPITGTDGMSFPVADIGGEASQGEKVKIRFDFFWAGQGIRVNRFEYIMQF